MSTGPSRVVVGVSLGLSLALGQGACGSAAPDRVTTTQTATVRSTETVQATVTATATPMPTTEPTPVADEGDVTETLLAANPTQPWRSLVVGATRISTDTVEVQTTIVDPRGGSVGSREAREAIAICKAVVALLKSDRVNSPRVTVYETNGSTFAYSGTTSDFRCAEY